MGAYRESTQVKMDRSMISCGVIEAHHLPKNAAKTVFAIATHLYHKANPRPGCFIVWSDVIGGDEGERGYMLAKALIDLHAGAVISSPHEINPRTGNTICMWIFAPDHELFRKWYQDELANRVTE